MNVLELFSGTHSIGKVAKNKGFKVVSLDRDLNGECPFNSGYKSDNHIKKDIMTWDYKKEFKKGYFHIITASPVCLWWSHLRCCWVGRKSKSIHPTETITKKHIDDDIEKYGKPMVDKVFEIIKYFDPEFWWVENPQTGRMKEYIKDKPFYDVDYCKYSDWGYKKRTRLWTNIKDFEPKICKMDCENIIEIKTQDGDRRGKEEIKGETRKLHNNATCCGRNTKSIKNAVKNKQVIKGHLNSSKNSNWDGKGTLERYRIPEKLIEDLFLKCN